MLSKEKLLPMKFYSRNEAKSSVYEGVHWMMKNSESE